MFTCIALLDDSEIDEAIIRGRDNDNSNAISDNALLTQREHEMAFELRFLRELVRHAERLLLSIDETPITRIVMKQIIKITSLLVRGYNSRLNGFINELQYALTESELDALPSMQILNQSTLNEYTMTVDFPCYPPVILSQIKGIRASCGMHAVMHMLLSAGFKSNFFDFCEIDNQRDFASGFNRLNNGELCTIMSEINDVLRSFADTIAGFIPPSNLYAMISTKGTNKFNFCDFLKPSMKVNYGLNINAPGFRDTHKREHELSIKESMLYDIRLLKPTWLLIDVGMWVCIVDGITTTFTAGGCRYALHSFIANTGYHYVCCVIDVINDGQEDTTIVRIYDDMAYGVYTKALSSFDVDRIGALMFRRI